MAMNNPNYGFPSTSSFSSPFSSTPNSSPPVGIRPSRPRFANAGLSMYPRPRSSASKPNPDSSFSNNRFSDFSRNNPNLNSFSEQDNSLLSDNSTNSNYYSCDESFYQSPNPNTSGNRGSHFPSPQSNNAMYPSDNFHDKNEVNLYKNAASFPQQFDTTYQNQSNLFGKSNLFGQISQDNKPQQNMSQPQQGFRFGQMSRGATKSSGGFKNFQNFKPKFGAGSFQRKFGKAKRNMAQQGVWRCDLCNLDFTSQIPLDMHLRGARHSRKMKSQNALEAIQSQGQVNEADSVRNIFRCEPCNLMLNSSLQLQMHLDGSKHRNKILKLEEAKEGALKVKEDELNKTENKPVMTAKMEKVVQNGKGNDSHTRPLPADFDDPRPTKIARFACDICNLIVNSDIQLQQHLGSKKHEAKVQGIPYGKMKKVFKKQTTENEKSKDEDELQKEETMEESELFVNPNSVLGVRSLQASFVPGETIN